MAKVLVIIPYSFYPPMNGGSLRCFYLLRSLAEVHEVYLLTVQPETELQQEECPPFPATVQIVSLADAEKFRTFFNRVLSERIADGLNTRWLLGSLKTTRNDFLLKARRAMDGLTCKTDFDAVIYENLEAFVWLRTYWGKKECRPLQILDAHNVDSQLWKEQAIREGSKVKMQYAKSALATEKGLAETTGFVLACSQHDFQLLQTLNNNQLKGAVVPNGVDVDAKPFDASEGKAQLTNLLFCGSLSYTPNREGLLWFYRKVFPLLLQKLPRLTLTVIGQCNDTAPFAALQSDPAVDFVGPVDSVLPYYYKTSVAVVPLLTGSGTRLKILEAMALGNPVVSTTKGAEGLKLWEGQEIKLADEPLSFTRAIMELLADREAFNRQRTAARQLVERLYDWNVIGRRLNCELVSRLENEMHNEHAQLD